MVTNKKKKTAPKTPRKTTASKKPTSKKTANNKKTKTTTAKKAPRTKKPLHPQIRAALLLFIAFLIILNIFPLTQAIINYQSRTHYLNDIETIPLPTSFIEESENSLVYDTPEGRIVETLAKGNSTQNAIIEFYTQALPELGWTKESNHNNKIAARFIKNKERLEITITDTEKEDIIKFYLSPHHE